MPAQVSGIHADLSMLHRAISNESRTYEIYTNQLAAIPSIGINELARQYSASHGGMSEDALSTMVLTNLGLLPNADLQVALKDYLIAIGKINVGTVALQLGQILSGLENATGDLAIYSAAAVRWNNEVTASHAYSSNPANGMGPVGNSYFNVGTGTTLTLTSSVDVLSGTLYDDVFLAPAPGLLGSPDLLNGGGDGGRGDMLMATLGGGESVAPKLYGIETVIITAGESAKFSSANATDIRMLWGNGATRPATFADVSLKTTVGVQNSLSGGPLTVKFAGASGTLDSANILLADATGLDEVIAPGIELLLVRSSAGNVETTTNNTARITADAAEEIRIWGDQALTTTVTGAHVEVINATGLTGALDLAFTTTGSTPVGIIGGTAGDRINVNEASGGRVAIDAGAGDDTVIVGAANAHEVTLGRGSDTLTIVGLAGATARDLDTSSDAALGRSFIRVTDFESGVDVIRLFGSDSTAKAAPASAQLAGIAAASSLLDAVALAATTAGANKAIAFRYGADTYILVNDAVATLNANDSLVKLVGVSALADASWTSA
ncbi:bluetail domain-containing putative surface protein [Acidovorax sp. A1169]|uniref:bluetail domain-containing putative surface protein n=1 Tax=Acidovorax sp. A1169 TaxID=3059524 RepID=UPI002737B517|nr:bluetail domain-containing putative surface protein [Acidovorax sp. A1169]MDP4077786.1 bluetail domain-containing putative surface protein [Acidovorax sp. A1169]